MSFSATRMSSSSLLHSDVPGTNIFWFLLAEPTGNSRYLFTQALHAPRAHRCTNAINGSPESPPLNGFDQVVQDIQVKCRYGVVVKCGYEHDERRRTVVVECFRNLDSAFARHHDVEKYQVRLVLLHQLYCGVAISRVTNNGQTRLGVDQVR